MNLDTLKSQLKQHEGFKATAYKCPAGKLTIGYGRNIENKGVTEEEAEYLLENDIEECFEDLDKIFKNQFFLFPESAQFVFVDMRLNLGSQGFRGFKNMIAAAKKLDWKAVKAAMINSHWYLQVGERGMNLVAMIGGLI